MYEGINAFGSFEHNKELIYVKDVVRYNEECLNQFW